jgi:MarR family transcriptional regulator, negative regulator of the multidrug operon emrRAB
MQRGVSGEADAALGNVVAALVLALADRITEATEQAAGRGGQAPAALVALHEFLEGSTIEHLAQTLGLSHSAAVRLVDRLVADGQVFRRPGSSDGRTVAIALTPLGRTVAESILSARRGAVEESLASLSEQEGRSLQATVGKLLGAITRSRLAERAAGRPPTAGWLCRLCDFEACGRPADRCPTATAALRWTQPTTPSTLA